ncbi:unnamed protein product [Paramecium pentaurelia]|uniref:Uncharacterized protein n=1 Tax=Paramecium pentaurelia TaxID=43138 RepID=A0A8S1YHF7_9CILI|nr:unnamed protein product [Paramecium pentaurelia]
MKIELKEIKIIEQQIKKDSEARIGTIVQVIMQHKIDNQMFNREQRTGSECESSYDKK